MRLSSLVEAQLSCWQALRIKEKVNSERKKENCTFGVY